LSGVFQKVLHLQLVNAHSFGYAIQIEDDSPVSVVLFSRLTKGWLTELGKSVPYRPSYVSS
jgi:hypothetical protein